MATFGAVVCMVCIWFMVRTPVKFDCDVSVDVIDADWKSI